ncbi:MAG: hypothetical protein WBB22_16225 [Anaerolineae bacterium]
MITPPAGVSCECHPEVDYTPKLIFVQFYDLIQCPGNPVPPNGHLFSCFQDDINPCKWNNVPSAAGWEVEVQYMCGQNQTEIWLGRGGVNNFFDGLLNGFQDEHAVFSNIWSGCNAIYGSHSGHATLLWLSAATHILTFMALPNDGHTFMEFFMTSDDKPVYKFCNTRWSLNQRFLYDP